MLPSRHLPPGGGASACSVLSAGTRIQAEAAQLRNRCRRAGGQVGTIDALIAQLCLRHDLTLLTTDNDFAGAAKHRPLRLWK